MDVETEPRRQLGRILIVDDSNTSRTWARLFLQQAGYHAQEAETAHEALKKIAESPPDLLLLDVILPDMDGFELTRHLRENEALATIPIILVTTLGDVDSKVRGLEAGANDFLTKPPDNAELLARVRTLLRLKRNQEELVAERNKTALLYRISRELSAELDLDSLLSRILELTIDSVGASRGSIILLDEWGRALRNIFTQRGKSATVTETVWERIVQAGVAGWVIEHLEGTIVADAQEDPRWVVGEGAHAITRSVLSVPLIHEGRIAGVLTLTHEQVGWFNPDHLDLLTSVASQAAVVIEKARAYMKEQGRARQLQLVNEVGREITSILELKQLLQEVARRICESFDYYSVEVVLLEGEELLYQGWDYNRDHKKITPTRIALSDEGIVPWAARNRKSLFVPDVRRESRYHFVPELPDTVAEFAVPLIAGGGVLGVLDIQSDRHGQITEDELPLLEILAYQVAVAMVNARLFETVEREHGRMQAILTGTADAIVATDGKGRIILLNPATERAFGVSFDKAAGRPFQEALPHQGLVQALQEAREQADSPHTAEVPLDDGRTLFASISSVAGPQGEGGWVVVMQDITHLKELERMKNEFVSTVSHDLRTPLTAIRGFAEILLGRIEGEQENRSYVRHIKTSAEQMAELVEDLLDLGKIEAGVESVRVPWQLEELARQAVEESSFQASLRQVELTSSIAESVPPVLCDPRQMRQVLDNLLSNALKYTPAGGTIVIRTRAQDRQVLVEVQDNGIGIPREALPRLFEKFYRVPCRETEEIAGTGLGLAIVKAIIDQHGGEIWVESELDQGSTFGFSLPCYETSEVCAVPMARE